MPVSRSFENFLQTGISIGSMYMLNDIQIVIKRCHSIGMYYCKKVLNSKKNPNTYVLLVPYWKHLGLIL